MSSTRRSSAVIAVVAALLVLTAVLGIREPQIDTELAAPVPTTQEVQPATASPAPIDELPEEAIRSALTGICSDVTSEADDKEWTLEELDAQIGAHNELVVSLSEGLSVSSSAEHLHLAALLDKDPTSRIELLDRAISGSPSDPFLLWDAVQICFDSRDSASCPLQDWEQRLIAVDSQNSESWVRVAANRYSAGESDAALEAMRHAATAAVSRIYRTERIEMIERGLAAGSNYAFSERAIMAFDFAFGMELILPRYRDYVTMCTEQSAQNVDWAYACLAYGELVENQGKTKMGAWFARSIQKSALEALGELESAAAVEQQLQASSQEMVDSIRDYNPAIERLIVSNPTFFYSYLAAVRSKGELEARLYLAEEVERLLEQQPELACEPI